MLRCHLVLVPLWTFASIHEHLRFLFSHLNMLMCISIKVGIQFKPIAITLMSSTPHFWRNTKLLNSLQHNITHSLLRQLCSHFILPNHLIIAWMSHLVDDEYTVFHFLRVEVPVHVRDEDEHLLEPVPEGHHDDQRVVVPGGGVWLRRRRDSGRRRQHRGRRPVSSGRLRQRRRGGGRCCCLWLWLTNH